MLDSRGHKCTTIRFKSRTTYKVARKRNSNVLICKLGCFTTNQYLPIGSVFISYLKKNTDRFLHVVTIIKTQSMVRIWCIKLQESDELNGVESVVGTPRRPLSPNSASRDPAKPAAPVDYSRYVRRYSSALECSSSYCKDLNYRSVKRLINTYLYMNKINTPRNNGSRLYFLYLIAYNITHSYQYYN